MSSLLSTLHTQHPRLFLLAGEEERIRQTIATDPLAADYFATLQAEGEEILLQPPIEHTLVGREPTYMYMLGESRRAVHHVYSLALLYRLTGQSRWAERAIEDMLTAARMDDWNPAHWLDTAEMMNALATGYDWLYDILTLEQRTEIRQAIYQKGLLEAEIAYWDAPERLRRDNSAPRAWWARNAFNWNNVCNSGVIVGALALADDYPDLAEKLVAEALLGLPYALASYAPDGAWAEGPGYWAYATHYTTLGFAALETALGSDFGLGELPGMAEAGWFRMHGAGPNGRYFNFADAAEDSSFDPSFYYLALRYRNPAYAQAAAFSRQIGIGIPRAGAYARALLWYQPERFAEFALSSPAPLTTADAHYKNTHLAFFRSAWDDPQAFYVGFKGGDNKANHSHIDLGVFVFDALGQRWFSDLCGDDYTLPGYWETHGRRWSYYRLSTAGHNTLLINTLNQDPDAEAPLIAFSSAPAQAYAIADLTAAYAPAGALRVQRRVALCPDSHGRPRRALLIEDEVETLAPAMVEWRAHTPAAVEVDGSTAYLRQGGKTMVARLLAPAGAVFCAEAALTTPPQRPISGITRLMVRLDNASQTTIRVQVEEE